MRRGRWRGILLAGAAITAVLWASSAWSSGRLPVAAPIVVDHAWEERADTVARNETLSELFARHNIAGADLLAFLEAARDLNPRRIRPRTVFTFRYPVDADRPSRVRVRVSDDLFLNVLRSGGGWTAQPEPVTWTIHTEVVRGAIDGSLHESVHDAVADSVLSYAGRSQLIWGLADVFQWLVDFTRDNYPGDGFAIVYERLVSSLGEVRFGRVLAARVETRGRENLAYVLPDARGRNAYYDDRGLSLRRAFKMYPVEFRRISSGFTRRRFHPVLGVYRAHLGTDYSAAYGTPVYATGDGVVTRAGRWGGYGNVVTIRHTKGIETRYAHLQRILVRRGQRVKQDDIIGQVGSTGLANGPHVHYEFLKNGSHVNPRGVDLGDGEPVPAGRRAEFDSVRVAFDRLLGRVPSPPAEVD